MGETTTVAANEGGFDISVWMMIIIAIGFYLLITGLKGNKKIEENYPDTIREAAAKTAKKFYLVLGIDMIVLAGLELLIGKVVLYVLAISAPVIMVGYVVISFKKYGKAIRESEDKHWKDGF